MPFKEFLESNLLSINKKNVPQYLQSLQTGLYYKNISYYLEFFESSQIKIIYLEDLKNKQTKTLNEICKFLKIAIWYNKKINLKYNQTISFQFTKLNMTYKKLNDFFRANN